MTKRDPHLMSSTAAALALSVLPVLQLTPQPYHLIDDSHSRPLEGDHFRPGAHVAGGTATTAAGLASGTGAAFDASGRGG